MTDELHHTISQASSPLEPPEVYLAQVKRWLEGYVEDNKQFPGLIAMVTEMYDEAKLRRERREAFARAIASGGALAIFGIAAAWLKDHLK